MVHLTVKNALKKHKGKQEIKGGNFFNKILNKTNFWGNKNFKQIGSRLGQITNDHLLPMTTELMSNVGDPFTFGISSEIDQMMKDYKSLSLQEKQQLDKMIVDNYNQRKKRAFRNTAFSHIYG